MNNDNEFVFEGIDDEALKEQQSSIWADIYNDVLNDKSVVYDIGAFRGVTVRGFGELGCKVHAFEASPRNHDYLIKNTKDLKNVICHKVGLHISNYKTLTKFKDCIGFEHPPQEINYVRIDDYIIRSRIEKPDYIKMDIEGMESVVMLTCEQLINEIKPVWQLSLHQNIFGYGDDCPEWIPSESGGFEFSSLLNNYVAFIPSKGTLVKTNEIVGCMEYLLIPKEHRIFLREENKGLLSENT